MLDNIQITVERDAEGKPFVSFKSPLGVDRTEYKYRRFHDMNEFLAFAGIKQQVYEHVTHKLRGVPSPVEVIEFNREPTVEETEAVKQRKDNYNAKYAKLKNEAIFKYTRVPQKEFLKLINGKMFEAFVKPIPELIKLKLCFGRNKLSMDKVNKVIKALPLLSQAYADKQTNILPFILHTNKSPKELKEMLGKGLWKRVCSNTFSRNKAIIEASSVNHWMHLGEFSPAFKKELTHLVTVPTSLLKYGGYSSNTINWLKTNCKGIWNRPADIKRQADFFIDTARMIAQETEGDQTEIQVKMLNWSVKRVNDEHEAATKRIFNKRFSKDRYHWADLVPIGPFMYEGYLVTPLFDSYSIAEEGEAMQHCVGSYAYQSQRGDYLVLSVTKDGERHSTIGMFLTLETHDYYAYPAMDRPTFMVAGTMIHKDTKVERKTKVISLKAEFQQQYKRFNRLLDPDDKAHEIPAFISRMINT